MKRLLASQTLVLVVDVQDRLAAAMPAARMAETTRKIGILLAASELLGASVLATEQYPKGLGPTTRDGSDDESQGQRAEVTTST